MITGNGWINDKFSDFVVFLKQKEVKKEDIDQILKENGYKRISEVEECTMKHRVNSHPEFGNNGYWEVCDSSERGASKFYFCEYEYCIED